MPVEKFDIDDAALHLAKSMRGRSALRRLRDWFADDGLGLDEQNKDAVLTILAGAFGSFPGTAGDAIHAALADESHEDHDDAS